MSVGAVRRRSPETARSAVRGHAVRLTRPDRERKHVPALRHAGIVPSRGSDDFYKPTERFDLYLRKAEELRMEPAVQQGHFNIALSLKFEAGGPLTARSKEPDETLFRSFLMTFRMFVSNDEPVYVNRVHNVLWANIRSDELKGDMQRAAEKWKRSCHVGALQIVTGEGPKAPSHLMDIWINGWYFHNDRRKTFAVGCLMASGIPFARHAFLNHVLDATNYVFFVAQVIVVGRRSGLLD